MSADYWIEPLNGEPIGPMTMERMQSIAAEKRWFLVPVGGYDQDLSLVCRFVACSVIRTITIARLFEEPVMFTELEP